MVLLIFIIHNCLQVNPEKRITTNDLLQHPWLCEGYGSSVKWMTPYDVCSNKFYSTSYQHTSWVAFS